MEKERPLESQLIILSLLGSERMSQRRWGKVNDGVVVVGDFMEF